MPKNAFNCLFVVAKTFRKSFLLVLAFSSALTETLAKLKDLEPLANTICHLIKFKV
jgi:hypothetical protein